MNRSPVSLLEFQKQSRPRDAHPPLDCLSAVLKAGAEAVGCQAAAYYLLDDATTQLALRSSWGLALHRRMSPPRPLAGALADLEAMLGHAVVLDDPAAMEHWRSPEDFASAVCLPVSTDTNILGTAWFYCERARDFDSRQTSLMEVIAGRLAAETDRELLLGQAQEVAELGRELLRAKRLQQSQLPTLAPLFPEWDAAGWSQCVGGISGGFFDWFCLPGGLLAVASAVAHGGGLRAALCAASLRAALRAHGQYYAEPQAALNQANLTLWTGAAGDQQASLCYSLLQLSSGTLLASTAGNALVLLARGEQFDRNSCNAPAMGESPESVYNHAGIALLPGDMAISLSTTEADRLTEMADCAQSALAGARAAGALATASDAVEAIRKAISDHCRKAEAAVLAVRRRGR